MKLLFGILLIFTVYFQYSLFLQFFIIMNAVYLCSSPIYVYYFNDNNFQVFEGADRLLPEFRLICNSIYHTKNEDNDLPILPLILLPEQVQILLENGFAQIRSVTNSFEGNSSAVEKYEGSNLSEENTTAIRDLAQRILIGRKLKAKSEAASEKDSDESKPVVKVRKLNWQKYAREVEKKQILPEEFEEWEVEQTIEELRMRELAKESKRLLKYCGPSSYVLLSQPYPFPQSSEYAIKLIVFRDLWRKGFYLGPGIKFGCDYLAYEKPPGEEHSKYMVICVDANKSFKPLDVVAFSRVGTQVKKRILMAIVSTGTLLPYYMEMNWWKGDGIDGGRSKSINI